MIPCLRDSCLRDSAGVRAIRIICFLKSFYLIVGATKKDEKRGKFCSVNIFVVPFSKLPKHEVCSVAVETGNCEEPLGWVRYVRFLTTGSYHQDQLAPTT